LPLRPRSALAAPEEVPLAFHDVGPDGWGKGVLDQAFPHLMLSTPEYLALGGLGRTGDLAFGPTPEGPETWVPEAAPLMQLPGGDDDLEALLVAAAALEMGDADGHHLKLLFRHSADVGGARPKARLRHRGRDCIAKFPAWGDAFDNPRVEAACLDVAEAAGVPVPEREVVSIGGRSALLLTRFDRSSLGKPYGYLSAATLLGHASDAYQTQKTYVDIAVVARTVGVRDPEPQIFRRLLVNSYLHNTDDHLRNHALIDKGAGWQLSPAFDIVPHIGNLRHVCAPAPGVGPELDHDLAWSAYERFGLARQDADAIRDEVVTAVRRFPDFLDARGVPSKDRSLLAGSLGRSKARSPGAVAL
jgi:serine/threonine-protein kinase HipA